VAGILARKIQEAKTLGAKIFQAMIFEAKPFETVIFETKTLGGKIRRTRLPRIMTGDAQIAGPKLTAPRAREAELDPLASFPSRRIETSR
jgi:hypothetical protein